MYYIFSEYSVLIFIGNNNEDRMSYIRFELFTDVLKGLIIMLLLLLKENKTRLTVLAIEIDSS